jgi:hypothetical protein
LCELTLKTAFIRLLSLTHELARCLWRDRLLAGPALIFTQPGIWVFRNGALTVNPNIGGFGQEECECVLQPTSNVIYHLGFSLCVEGLALGGADNSALTFKLQTLTFRWL